MKTLYAISLLFALFQPKTIQIVPTTTTVIKVAPRAESGQETRLSPSAVREYVAQRAKRAGISVTDALWVLDHESQDGKNLYGDDGNSLGYFMISTIYHPEVPRSCSLNLPCSTTFFINGVKKGKINEWSTFACKYVWFYKEAVATFGLPPKGYVAPKYCSN